MEGCGEVCVSLSWGVHLPPNKHVPVASYHGARSVLALSSARDTAVRYVVRRWIVKSAGSPGQVTGPKWQKCFCAAASVHKRVHKSVHLRPRKRPSLWRQVHSVQLHISRWSSPKGGFFARCVNLKAALRSCAKQGILPKVDLCNLSVENPQGLKKQLNDLSNSFTLGNTPGDRTCTHHVRDRCPICFGNLLLSCSDVFGSQIGSTESGNPVWTYENRRFLYMFFCTCTRARCRHMNLP